MKNHIGYSESTVLKPMSCGGAGQKKSFPTKKPPIHTFFVVSTFCLNPLPLNATGIEGVNLPEMSEPEARL